MPDNITIMPQEAVIYRPVCAPSAQPQRMLNIASLVNEMGNRNETQMILRVLCELLSTSFNLLTIKVLYSTKIAQ